jgi:adenylate kinase
LTEPLLIRLLVL